MPARKSAAMAGESSKAGTALRLLLLACMCGCSAMQEHLSSSDLEIGERFRDCALCPEMVVVPAGSFLMGSPPDEEGRYDDEGPQHAVTIAQPFAVGVYEVTFAEWDACAAAGGCKEWTARHRPPNEDWSRLPVSSLSWYDAHAYVQWLSDRTGERYRLPSEAEWEYAARAGATTPYHTGWTISMAQANYDGSFAYGAARGGGYDRREVAPVGSYAANGWGLHDVHGNVGEWVQDCWHDSYVGAPADGQAWEDGCVFRVSRSGGWGSSPRGIRTATRDDDKVSAGANGFRVVQTVAVQDGSAVASRRAPAHGTYAKTDGVGTMAVRNPEPGRLAEAAALALRVLHDQSWWRMVLHERSPYDELLPDEDRLAELTEDLAEVLARLRNTFPEFARFRVRPQNAFGLLRVRFTDDFAAVVREVGQVAADVRGDRRDAFRVGHDVFDELNENLGLRHIDVPPEGWDSFVLHLHEHVNLDAASKVYSAVDLVESATPVGRVIDGSDINATQTDEGWRIVIHNRWGSCPTGCTTRERFLFVAEGETIERGQLEGEPDSPSLPHYLRRRS